MMVFAVKFGVIDFMVWFFDLPDLRILQEPVDGPEHNYKLARLLRILKTKRPDSMLNENGQEINDREACRREWLVEIRNIETRLGGELQEQLNADAGKYLQ